MEREETGVEQGRQGSRPLQFGLRGALAITAAVSVLFGTLRWLGVPVQASYVILLVLLASAAGAAVLVVMIAQSAPEDDESE